MARCLATRAAAAAYAELREYTLKPESVGAFLELSAGTAGLRATLPFMGFFQCESGGVLTRVIHAYLYDDLAERDALRAALATTPAWQAYLAASRPCVAHQQSMLLAVPPCAAAAARAFASSSRASSPGVFEYSLLRPAAGTRARARAAGAARDPATPPEADRDAPVLRAAGGEPVLGGHVLLGPRPGGRVRLWRFPSVAAAVGARLAADGGATPGGVHRQLLKPVPWSPWR